MNHNSFLTVLKGKYKNKKIPVPKKIHGHNNVTPQKIKESIFQIIENKLDNTFEPKWGDTLFIDLFSGSGQMGLEAISQGFNHAFFFDISKERIQKLSLWMRQNMIDDHPKGTFEIKDGIREFYKIITGTSSVNRFLEEHKQIKQVVIFADPPYGLNSKRKYLIDNIIDYKTLNPNLEKEYSMLLIIQTCNVDLYRSNHKIIENYPETGAPDYIKGFYEYGRHRILIL
ncbi:MAG: RsmD family RNA methyltransferase [Spirochaetia bacterium]|nr:RsmD family RNA methyltransferase [Spirochaetia bacterium]